MMSSETWPQKTKSQLLDCQPSRLCLLLHIPQMVEFLAQKFFARNLEASPLNIKKDVKVKLKKKMTNKIHHGFLFY